MNSVARLIHLFERKFLKKRRNSIEGVRVNGRLTRMDVAPRMMKEEMEDEKDETPPLTPVRSANFLRNATPIKTLGILVHEGSDESPNEDGVSQAEDCIDWDEPIHEIHVDTAEEFVINGGEESSSLLYEEEDEVEMEVKKESVLERSEKKSFSDFIVDNELEEDSFNEIVVLQSMIPTEVASKRGYFIHPSAFGTDSDGYEWDELDEPMRFPDTSLALPVPSNLTQEVVSSFTRSLIEEGGLRKESEIAAANTTYVVSPEVSPMIRRPDTPIPIDPTVSPSGICRGSNLPSTTCSFSPIARPPCARDEDNAWLRSLYEKAGLSKEITDWMRIDPPKKEENCIQKSSPVTRNVMKEGNGFATSTPQFDMVSPAFSSVSTIVGRLNDSSRSFNSPGLNYTLEMGVRARVALSRPIQDFYKLTPDMDYK